MSINIPDRLMLLFKDAFSALSVEITDLKCQQLAGLIHEAMDHNYRVYHTSAHLFDLCQDIKPKQILAALFHDIIYLPLDYLSSPNSAQAILNNLGKILQNNLIFQPSQTDSVAVEICSHVFGFSLGEHIPLSNGGNEFLSAVLAIDVLKPYLPLKDLIAIAAYIEATIPFRGQDENNRQPPELLAERIAETAKQFTIELSKSEIDEIVTDSVVLANRDVASFAYANPSYFLSTTWLLLEETNTAFKTPNEYTIQDYRNALLKMEKFFTSLNPEQVFHYYQNTPDQKEFNLLSLSAKSNIEFALNYIGAKIAGISLIEALALLTGGDCPIVNFLGDFETNKNNGSRFMDFIPSLSDNALVDPDLLAVLVTGRSQASSYDLTESPLTAYLCCRLGLSKVLAIADQAKQMFSGQLTPRNFLNSIDANLVQTFAYASSKINNSRSEQLLALEFHD